MKHTEIKSPQGEAIPPLFLSDLPIPPPPPMNELLMTSRFDFGFRSPDLNRSLARPRGFMRNSLACLRDFGSPLMSRAEYSLARSWRMPQRPVIKVARCRLDIFFISF